MALPKDFYGPPELIPRGKYNNIYAVSIEAQYYPDSNRIILHNANVSSKLYPYGETINELGKRGKLSVKHTPWNSLMVTVDAVFETHDEALRAFNLLYRKYLKVKEKYGFNS